MRRLAKPLTGIRDTGSAHHHEINSLRQAVGRLGLRLCMACARAPPCMFSCSSSVQPARPRPAAFRQARSETQRCAAADGRCPGVWPDRRGFESQSQPAERAVLSVQHRACMRLLMTMLHAAQHSALRHK